MIKAPVSALLAVPLLAACADRGETPLVAEEILQLNAQANQVVIGLEHNVASEGIRRAHVVADTAFFIEDQTIVELLVMQVTFFDATGQVTSILTARMGTYDWDTADMVAEEDVVVINPAEGRRIETSVMYYNRAEDRIWSDAPTQMYEADGTIVEGSAFESNSGLDEVQLTSARLVKPTAPSQNQP